MLEETQITPELIESYAGLSDKPKDSGLLEASRNNVITFAKQMLGVELYTWQKIVASDIMEAINDESLSREFVVLTSRQIGKTEMAAIMALWIAVFNKLPNGIGNISPCGIISASDKQSRRVLKRIKELIRIGDQYCREKYSREKGDAMDKGILSMLLDPEGENNQQTVTFKANRLLTNPNGVQEYEFGEFLLKESKGGTTINSFPPTTVVLGETFSYLHEDEAGLTERFTDEVHKEYLKPTGDAYDAIRLYTSTPWVPSGFFYELADPDDNRPNHNYKRYLFTIDAIRLENSKQYQTVMDNIEEMRRNGEKDEVERAYYCRFVKGEKSYFDPEAVDEIFDDDLSLLSSYGEECDIGIDFGGEVKSRSVITVSAMVDGQVHRLYHKVYPVGEDSKLMEDLEHDVMKRFPKWQRLIPDDCPAGYYRIKQMIAKGWNVEPMSFRTWKVKKYGAFRSMMGKGKVKSYPDDELKIEMKALEFGQGKTQSVITAPRGYNDDLIDSFVMSSFFFLDEEKKVSFYSWGGVWTGE